MNDWETRPWAELRPWDKFVFAVSCAAIVGCIIALFFVL